MRLLLLLHVDSALLIVFFNHALHNRVYLALLFDIFLVCLSSKLFIQVDLVLDISLVLLKLFELFLILFSLLDVVEFLVLEHGHVNLSIFFNFDLLSELTFSHLLRSFLVQISCFNFVL